MSAAVTLILGGARSGKSELAERQASTLATVAYVATAAVDRHDEDFQARIERHRDRRPRHWRTVEVGAGEDLAAVLDAVDDPVLVDSLGTWLAGHDEFAVDAGDLVAALGRRDHPSILVSDEVGLGVHPTSQAGRTFRDALGDLNRAVADVADTVLLVVAGRVVQLA